MSKGKSRLDNLEIARGGLSLYVFFHHFIFAHEELAGIQRFLFMGQASVMTFFVMSGFVIYYATLARRPSLDGWDYTKRRVLRIFPVFLLSLIWSWLFRSIEMGSWMDLDWKTLLGNVAMLQDKHPYSIVKPYMHNLSLWSLSYEFYFYMLFIPLVFIASTHVWRQRLVGLGFSIIGFASFWLLPNQFSLFLAYFFLWWAGAELCREYVDKGKVTFKGQWFTIGSLATLSLLWALPTYMEYLKVGHLVRAQFPFIQSQHFILIFLIVVGSIAWHKLHFIGLKQLFGWCRYLAPISYGIYVFHLPVVYAAKALKLMPHPALDLIWVLPLVMLISWIAERPLTVWLTKLVFPVGRKA